LLKIFYNKKNILNRLNSEKNSKIKEKIKDNKIKIKKYLKKK